MEVFCLKYFIYFFINLSVVDYVYNIYIAFIMAKENASFRIRSDLRKALKREADREKRTLSWYLESIIEDFARRKKLV